MSQPRKLIAMVAMTPERVIGKDGGLPWHLPEDLQVFKKYTTGHPIIMGRKTWDSIGRPLPKRQNIVLTRDPNWSAEGAKIIHAPAELEDLELIDSNVFIIGGAQVYQAFLPLLDEILVSHIYENHPGDTKLAHFEADFPHVKVIEQYDSFELKRYTR